MIDLPVQNFMSVDIKITYSSMHDKSFFSTHYSKYKNKTKIRYKKNFPVGASRKEFGYHCRTLKRNGLDP